MANEIDDLTWLKVGIFFNVHSPFKIAITPLAWRVLWHRRSIETHPMGRVELRVFCEAGSLCLA
jgi:hypothetical protein